MKIKSLFPTRKKSDLTTDEADTGIQAPEVSPPIPEDVSLRTKRKFGKSGKTSTAGPLGPTDIQYVERGVLRLRGRNFAVGLIWVPAIEDANLKDHALVAGEVAKSFRLPEVEFTFVTGSIDDGLLGFGTGSLGHSSRMPSLVKSIKSEIAGVNWLIAIKAHGADLWWIGSVRDDVVFLDRVFTNEENAMVAFMEALSAPSWHTIVAPEDWHIQKAISSIDGEIITEKGARLRHYSPLRAYGPRILLGTMLVGGAAGVVLYYQAEQKRFAAEQAAQRARIERAITLSPEDHPWFRKPSLAAFTETCSREIQKAIVFAAGWENQVFTCTVDRGLGTVQTGWEREGGTISWLRAALPAGFPDISVAEGLDIATVQTSFEIPVEASAFLEQPWPRDVIESRLPERFQVRAVEHDMRFVEDMNPPETSALFHRHDVQVKGDMALESLIPLLEDIPALVPETLVYNLATSGWSFVFRLHHPVIVPEVPQP